MRGAKSYSIRARVGGPDGFVTIEIGRVGWALDQLLQAGARGITPVSHPAPRWSDYIFRLRGHGFDIETIDEPHAGAFAGTHARYVLRSEVEVLERSGATAPPRAPVPAGSPLEYGRRA